MLIKSKIISYSLFRDLVDLKTYLFKKWIGFKAFLLVFQWALEVLLLG